MMQANSSDLPPNFQILQLPGPALNGILQKLDPCSVACAARTCSKFREAVPASITKVALHCSSQEQHQFESLKLWLQRYGSIIKHCIIEDLEPVSYPSFRLDHLPCPQLLQLSLKYVDLQLEPAGNCPGVLQGCTGLQELDLENCAVEDTDAAFAAIAALPELRSLSMAGIQREFFYNVRICSDLQLLTRLTKLRFDARKLKQREQLVQLSALTSLEELCVAMPQNTGVPGGLPSQLQKLTRLHVRYGLPMGCRPAEQFQHLSSLTALQDLKVAVAKAETEGSSAPSNHRLVSITAAHLAGIQHMPQLTSLEISCHNLQFSAADTNSWAHSLTALERLSLSQCVANADAIAAFTQLRALSVCECEREEGLDGLLLAVSGLPHLTELCIRIKYLYGQPGSSSGSDSGSSGGSSRSSSDIDSDSMSSTRSSAACSEDESSVPPSAAATCTALTVSTNLCSLQFGVGDLPADFILFSTVYPRLRRIELWYDWYVDEPGETPWMPVTNQQLQQLCSCCPAVESLGFAIDSREFSPAAFSPLLQLSVLTCLEVTDLHRSLVLEGGDATAAAVEVAAQLTGLKQLTLVEFAQLTNDVKQQLTALTGLEKLRLKEAWSSKELEFENKARPFTPPDVCHQLQDYLVNAAKSANVAGSSAYLTPQEALRRELLRLQIGSGGVADAQPVA